MQLPTEADARRFWSKVDRSGGPNACWPWLACRHCRGYGEFGLGLKVEGAHRVAWALEHKRVPKKHVLHTCDNPPCCNPAHLVEGTHQQNMKDRNTRGRQAKGKQHGSVKLTEIQITLIRKRALQGEGIRALAAEFCVNSGHLSRIASGKKWKHL